MKRIILFLLALATLTAWGQTAEHYFYHWEKQAGVPDAEDVILRCVTEKGMLSKVTMYCTTDEWDGGRLGYLPGFCVLEMHLKYAPDKQANTPTNKMPKGQFLLCTYPTGKMAFSAPVSTEYKTDETAWASGKYHLWRGENKHQKTQLDYALELNDDGTLNLYGNYLETRTFVPMSAAKVKNLNRNTLDLKLEAANRKENPKDDPRTKEASAIHQHTVDTLKKADCTYHGSVAVMKNGTKTPDGHGMITWTDSTTMEDDFHWGTPMGKRVKMIWADGTRYQGEWPTGKGRYDSPDGSVYEGDIVDRSAHGQGHRTQKDGIEYEGDFCKGKMTGHGKCVYPDGCIYDGEVLDGSRHGKGTFRWTNGTAYTGEWQDNKPCGQGRYDYANGNVYEGEITKEWEESLGVGQYSFPKGEVHEGEIIKMHITIAHGKMTYANGDVYEGEFVKDIPHGNGTYLWRNGDMVAGTFSYGVLQEFKSYTPAKWSKMNQDCPHMPHGAEFIGDYAAYVRDHLHYPEKARNAGAQGRVYVKFSVEKDGSIHHASVLRNSLDNKNLKKEALHFVKNMPCWRPATINDEPVKSCFVLPVTFMP